MECTGPSIRSRKLPDTTMPFPKSVSITEVGLRDGFQFEEKLIPTEVKRSMLEGLVEAGIQRIQVTSFVHPKWVPQMADAEALCESLPVKEGVIYSGLALNPRGVERAAKAGLSYVDLSISTNNQHSQDNANMTRDEAIEQAIDMITIANEAGMHAQMGLQCVFGYEEPGDTPLSLLLSMIDRFLPYRLESISLADSTGMANPKMINQVLEAVLSHVGDVPIVLHLHDTRGLGLANVYAALEAGISRFDTSIGGLGGCPFIPGATGNIATEDTVYMLDSLGIETHVDRHKVADVTREVAAFLGRKLPGKLYRL